MPITIDLPISRVRETLERGMRLFHDGMRDLAMEPLATVLRNPQGFPSWRLAAAGLLAEAYRGRGDFLRAEHYYRIGLAEAGAIDAAERPVNEWYLHYRPRCALGLITALRRLISSDHRTISAELRATRDLAHHVSIPDLPWQLGAVDGVYRRQCGDLDGSVNLLREALDGMTGLEGFCYWYPEHVEALLVQVRLLQVSSRAVVRRDARSLLDSATAGPWSKAVAAACHLHLQLDRMVTRRATAAQFIDALRDRTRGAGHLLDVLATNARDEGDPLLESESLILHLAWHLACGRTDTIAKLASELVEILTRAPSILSILRGCEARVLVGLFSGADTRIAPAIAELLHRGSRLLPTLRVSIASYGYSTDMVTAWTELLDVTARPAQVTGWLDGPLVALRCLAWP
jgi:hypothetical protein